MLQRLDRSPWTWLALGAALLIVSQMRFGLGVFAWFAPVPWLRYLRITDGWRSRVSLGGVTTVGWFLATAKIVTAPLPMIMALGFSVPFAVVLGLPFLVWSFVRKRLSGTVRMADLLVEYDLYSF